MNFDSERATSEFLALVKSNSEQISLASASHMLINEMRNLFAVLIYAVISQPAVILVQAVLTS